MFFTSFHGFADPSGVSIVLFVHKKHWIVFRDDPCCCEMGGSTGIMYSTICAKTAQERRMQNIDLNMHHRRMKRERKLKFVAVLQWFRRTQI
jgi:hypothetical protein